jgi:transposase
MIQWVRQGHSLHAVARQFGVDPATVKRWVDRTAGQRLDRAALGNRPSGARRSANRTAASLEEQILQTRSQLKELSDLGNCGAQAIAQHLHQQGLEPVPAVRTIGRVLARRGALSGRYRQRRKPPRPGWYLPAVVSGGLELDSFDIVEALAIKGGAHFELFNGISLRGALADTHIAANGHSARSVLAALEEHWRRHGLPGFAQFDNDSRFQGPHSRVAIISRVMRLCLALGVTPVFAPPRETGFQAAIENFNGLWQAKVWRRFTFAALGEVGRQSERFLAARRLHLAVRIAQAPPRPAIASQWRLDLQQRPQGRLIFLRRTGEQGQVELLGRRVMVDGHWLHRLVRCELDLDQQRVQCYGLSRREPTHQPLLNEVSFEVPHGRFHE